MKNALRLAATLVIAGSIGLGAAALLSAPVKAAGDYPCDPPYNLLKNCKAQHGRWDNSCCCCRLH